MKRNTTTNGSIYFQEELYNEILNGFLEPSQSLEKQKNDTGKKTILTSVQRKRLFNVGSEFVKSNGLRGIFRGNIVEEFNTFKKQKDEHIKVSLMMNQIQQNIRIAQQKEADQEEQQQKNQQKKQGGKFNIYKTLSKVDDIIWWIRHLNQMGKNIKNAVKQAKKYSVKSRSDGSFFDKQDDFSEKLKKLSSGLVIGVYRMVNSPVFRAFFEALKDQLTDLALQLAANVSINFALDIVIKNKFLEQGIGRVAFFHKHATLAKMTKIIGNGVLRAARFRNAILAGGEIVYAGVNLLTLTEQNLNEWDKYVNEVIRPILKDIGDGIISTSEELSDLYSNFDFDFDKKNRTKKKDQVSHQNFDLFRGKSEQEKKSTYTLKRKSNEDNKENFSVQKYQFYLKPLPYYVGQTAKERDRLVYGFQLDDESLYTLYNTPSALYLRKLNDFVSSLNNVVKRVENEFLSFFDDKKITQIKMSDDIKLLFEKLKSDIKREDKSSENEKQTSVNVKIDVNDAGVSKLKIKNDKLQQKQKEKINFQWGFQGVQVKSKNPFGYLDEIDLNVRYGKNQNKKSHLFKIDLEDKSGGFTTFIDGGQGVYKTYKELAKSISHQQKIIDFQLENEKTFMKFLEHLDLVVINE